MFFLIKTPQKYRFRALAQALLIIVFIATPTLCQAGDINQFKHILDGFIEQAKCTLKLIQKRKPKGIDEQLTPEQESTFDHITPEVALTFHRMGGHDIVSQGSTNFVHLKGKLTDVSTLIAPSIQRAFNKNHLKWWSMWPIFTMTPKLKWALISEDGRDALLVDLPYYGSSKISFTDGIPVEFEGIYLGGPPTTSAVSIQLQIPERSARESLKMQIEKIVFELRETDPEYGIGVLNTIGGLKLVFYGYFSSFDNAKAFSKIFGLTEQYYDHFGDDGELEEI